MDEILEHLPGVVGITDDICVYGKDEVEQDQYLRGLMEKAKKCGPVFNSEKCTIRQPEISFFGNIYSRDGIRPDPKMMQGTQSMPIPPDKEDMQKFIGIMTYVCVHPKRTTDVPFEMSEDHT